MINKLKHSTISEKQKEIRKCLDLKMDVVGGKVCLEVVVEAPTPADVAKVDPAEGPVREEVEEQGENLK
ncbi:hypothetical protein ES703_95744 [subsurface metagenome]